MIVRETEPGTTGLEHNLTPWIWPTHGELTVMCIATGILQATLVCFGLETECLSSIIDNKPGTALVKSKGRDLFSWTDNVVEFL